MSHINRIQDKLEIVLGVWLIASPWLLGYAQPFGAAAASASAIGVVVTVLSIDDYFCETETDEWIDAVFGIGLAVSPWLLGYSANAAATVNALVCGLLVAGIAAWAVQRLRLHALSTGWHLPRF